MRPSVSFDVTVLEAGKSFKPLALPLQQLAKFRKTGLYFDERMIQLLLPNMRIDKAQEMVMAFVVVWAWVFVVLFLRGEEALKASS